MANKFEIKAEEMKVMGELFSKLESMEKETLEDYRPLGTQRQSTNWRTGELIWEDEEHTIPKMEDVWGTVEVSEDELEDDKKLRLQAIRACKVKFEKLV